MIPELIKEFVDTGEARFVSREYPLNSIHPYAQKAAEAAVCAGRQDKYWEMHDKLFESVAEWSAEGADQVGLLKKYAGELGLEATAFGECLDKGEGALDVQADLMVGQSLGLQGTPSFYINDIAVPFGAPLDVPTLSRLIEYVVAGGTTPNIVPPTGDVQIIGNQQTAQAAMAAFVDMASPESAKYTLETFPQIKSTYVDPGKLIYIIHPWADKAGTPSFEGALAVQCAGEQAKFWEMQDQLFREQKEWTAAADPRSQFADYAQSLGLDLAKFEACLDSDGANLRVLSGAVIGSLYGAPAAPTYLFSNGQSLDGTATWDQFKTTIDSMFNQ